MSEFGHIALASPWMIPACAALVFVCGGLLGHLTAENDFRKLREERDRWRVQKGSKT